MGARKEAGEEIGKSGDEGIDGVINEDRLGLDVIYIQAKRQERNIGRPEIQKLVGALQEKRVPENYCSEKILSAVVNFPRAQAYFE